MTKWPVQNTHTQYSTKTRRTPNRNRHTENKPLFFVFRFFFYFIYLFMISYFFLQEMLSYRPLTRQCCITTGVYKQFGVTSWGMRGCDYVVPGVYVNVGYHEQWITANTGTLQTSECDDNMFDNYTRHFHFFSEIALQSELFFH